MAMTHDLYRHAERIQAALIQIAGAHPADVWAKHAPRVMLDAWATLFRWHEYGQRVWRISAAAANETADMVLPPDLPLDTARVRGEAVAYQLPNRGEWIVIARHAPAPCTVTVRGPEIGWAYAQPVLTYCTEIEGDLAAGYFSLADYPTAGSLPDRIQAGTTLGPRGGRRMGDADTTEEEARVALALIHHFPL